MNTYVQKPEEFPLSANQKSVDIKKVTCPLEALERAIERSRVLTIVRAHSPLLKEHKFESDGINSKVYANATKFNIKLIALDSLGDLRTILECLSENETLAIAQGYPSDKLLHHFNIKSVDQLVKLEEKSVSRNQENIGEASTAILILDIDGYNCGEEIAFDDDSSITRVVKLFIQSQLPEEFHSCSYIIKLSQSAGVKSSTLLCVHLFFILKKPATLAMMSDGFKYLQSQKLAQNVDLAIYRPAQLIFTSKPRFIGMRDPVMCDRVILVENGGELKFDFTRYEQQGVSQSSTGATLNQEDMVDSSLASPISEVPAHSKFKLSDEMRQKVNKFVTDHCSDSSEVLSEVLAHIGAQFDTPSAYRELQCIKADLSQRTDHRYISIYTITHNLAWKHIHHSLTTYTLVNELLEASQSNDCIADHKYKQVSGQIIRALLISTHHKVNIDSKKRSFEYCVINDGELFTTTCADLLAENGCFRGVDGGIIKLIKNDKDELEITSVSKDLMWAILSEYRWYKIKLSKKPKTESVIETRVYIELPQVVTRRYEMIAAQLFHLKSLVTHPLLDKKGDLVRLMNGYVHDQGVYVALSETFKAHRQRLIVNSPNESDGLAAFNKLKSLFVDFPLGENVFQAIASLMTLILAPLMINRPMIMIIANVRGAGKTMLAQILTIIKNGVKNCSMLSWRINPNEFDKSLIAMLMESPSTLIIDNATGRVGSPTIDSLITANENEIRLRILGKSETVSVKNKTTLIITGNNLTLGGDGDRRTLLVSMLSEHEKPEERRDFKIPNIVAHSLQHATEYWRAVLTLLKAYKNATQSERDIVTKTIKRTGSFEEWRECVQAPIYWATMKLSKNGFGVDVWRESQKQLVSDSHDELFELLEALAIFQKSHGANTWWRTGDLFKSLSIDYAEIMPLKGVLQPYVYSTSVKLGKHLQRYKNMKSGGYHLKVRQSKSKQNEYYLECDESPKEHPLLPKDIDTSSTTGHHFWNIGR